MPKYNSINNITARLFFEILESKDFSLLEPDEDEDEDGLDEVFSSIYNDYFIKLDNPSSKRYLQIEQEIVFLNNKIQSIIMVLDFLAFNETTKEIREKLLNALIEIGVNINLENDFVEEVKNVLNVEIGVISNDLSFLKIEKEEMQKQTSKTKFEYYDAICNMESILERNLPDEILLIKYISYEKMCEKKADAMKKQSQKYNK